VPPALAWYTEPGGLPKGAQIQALVQIPEEIRYTTSKLLWVRLSEPASAAIGLGLGIIVVKSGHVRGAPIPAAPLK